MAPASASLSVRSRQEPRDVKKGTKTVKKLDFIVRVIHLTFSVKRSSNDREVAVPMQR